MPRIAIVTDSSSDLSADLRQTHDVTTVPLNVQIGSEVYRDRVDITADQFLARLQQASQLPTTSQPSSGLFEEAFRRLAKDYDSVVAVLSSSKLSGTVRAATIARDAVASLVPVEIVDSLNVSLGLGLQVLRAAELASSGITAKNIGLRLKTETNSYHLVFFVDTLEYLERGAHIGRAASLVGAALKLKPLLRVDEGQVVPFERTRTRAKAIDGLKEFVRSMTQIQRLALLYSSSPDEAIELADDLGDHFPREEMLVAQFGPILTTHVGPGAIGVCVFEGASSESDVVQI